MQAWILMVISKQPNMFVVGIDDVTSIHDEEKGDREYSVNRDAQLVDVVTLTLDYERKRLTKLDDSTNLKRFSNISSFCYLPRMMLFLFSFDIPVLLESCLRAPLQSLIFESLLGKIHLVSWAWFTWG